MDTIDSLVDKINQEIGDKNYYYISNFIDHAQGLEKWIRNFKGIALWNTAFSEYLKGKGIEVFCFNSIIEEQSEVRSSAQILDFIIDNKLINFDPGQYFQTFKVSPRFASLVEKLQGKCLNTSDDLNRLFESKVSQAEIFDRYKVTFPQTIVTKLKDLNFAEAVKLLGSKFVVQFNRGHTGNGTLFITEESVYIALQQKFPHRIVRMSEYIDSPTYTINACLTRYGTYVSGLCRQISNIPELSNDPGATLGNNYVHGLTNTQIWDLLDEVKKIETALNEHGYKGLFGLDFLIKDNKVIILEINARQTMSIPFNSILQHSNSQIPIILLHIAEFLGLEYDVDIKSYSLENTVPLEAAQLILRNRSDQTIKIATDFKSGEYIFENNEMKFRNPGLYIDNIDKNNMLLMARLKDTSVSAGEELARLQIKQNLYTQASTLDSFYVKLLLELEKSLINS